MDTSEAYERDRGDSAVYDDCLRPDETAEEEEQKRDSLAMAFLDQLYPRSPLVARGGRLSVTFEELT